MATMLVASICDTCRGRITWSPYPGNDNWKHEDVDQDHAAEPELRFVIDATCPGCDFPEIGYSPALEQFICSRCGHTQDTRPNDKDT